MGENRTFPSIDVRSLEGEKLVIPEELAGKRNLLAVAFRREQQTDVDSWVPEFTRLEAENDDLVAYEVPVISRRWVPLRGFIDGGMTAAIPDPATRAHTLTSYTDVSRVVDGLGLDGTDQIAVVLCDRKGLIQWFHPGPRTPEAVDSLDRAVAK